MFLPDNNTTITTIDPDGISLAAIKELYRKTKEIETLKTELDETNKQLSELKEAFQKILAGQNNMTANSKLNAIK